MPVPILLQAGAARVSGEYLISAKTLSYLLAAALLIFTFVLLRRRCPTPVALMLSSTILVSGTGLVRNDVLPVILQLGAIALVARRQQLTLYHVAFACASMVTAIVLVDPGAFTNHLIDVQVLSLMVIGELWRCTSPRSGGLSLVSAAIVAALLAGSAVAYRQNVEIGSDVRALVHGAESRDRVPRLADSVSANESILSEDPFIPVSRGERPVVLDPFILVSIAKRHPHWRSDLVRRIESVDFDKVILLYPSESAPLWYSRVHFGEEIIRAVERRYRPAERVDAVKPGRIGRAPRGSELVRLGGVWPRSVENGSTFRSPVSPDLNPDAKVVGVHRLVEEPRRRSDLDEMKRARDARAVPLYRLVSAEPCRRAHRR